MPNSNVRLIDAHPYIFVCMISVRALCNLIPQESWNRRDWQHGRRTTEGPTARNFRRDASALIPVLASFYLLPACPAGTGVTSSRTTPPLPTLPLTLPSPFARRSQSAFSAAGSAAQRLLALLW